MSYTIKRNEGKHVVMDAIISLRLQKSLLERIDCMALEANYSRNKLINMLLEEIVSNAVIQQSGE